MIAPEDDTDLSMSGFLDDPSSVEPWCHDQLSKRPPASIVGKRVAFVDSGSGIPFLLQIGEYVLVDVVQ